MPVTQGLTALLLKRTLALVSRLDQLKMLLLKEATACFNHPAGRLKLSLCSTCRPSIKRRSRGDAAYFAGRLRDPIDTTNHLALLGYCVGEASPKGLRLAWSEPLPTGRNGEYISVMTRKRDRSLIKLPRTAEIVY